MSRHRDKILCTKCIDALCKCSIIKFYDDSHSKVSKQMMQTLLVLQFCIFKSSRWNLWRWHQTTNSHKFNMLHQSLTNKRCKIEVFLKWPASRLNKYFLSRLFTSYWAHCVLLSCCDKNNCLIAQNDGIVALSWRRTKIDTNNYQCGPHN